VKCARPTSTAAEFVTKPVDFDLLKQQLRWLLVVPDALAEPLLEQQLEVGLVVDGQNLGGRARGAAHPARATPGFRFARHGEEALAALAHEPDIDLLLLDINMPVMDGLILLARYFSPNIVDMLAEQDEPLGPVRHMVAVLFVDIVGFTRMAEAMAPEAVVVMLREFHECMANRIFGCGSTIEKYSGDEIFAVFGLPEASPHDTHIALRCAASMLDELEAWNQARTEKGELPLAIGIGVNHGPAVLGDVGTEHSLSFAVIGDTVNVASRLQSLTRELKTPLVVADAVVRQINGERADRAIELPIDLQDRGQ
jgi:class 3 adenylate cyclase